MLCHSTLTNTLTRNWLEKMRGQSEKQVDSEAGGEEFIFHHISFLENHLRCFKTLFLYISKKKRELHGTCLDALSIVNSRHLH